MNINAAVSFEFVWQILYQTHIKVFTAEECITVSRQYFKLLFAIDIGNFNNRDIEGTATQIVNSNDTVAGCFVDTIGQCRGSWLIDNTFDVQTSNTAGIFSRLTLWVVKICRYRNYCFRYCLTQVVFGGLFHFLQYFSRNLWRSFAVPFDFYPGIAIVCLNNFVGHHFNIFLHYIIFKATTDQALNRIYCIVRVGHCLTLGWLTDQNFTFFSESDNRWRRSGALCIFNDFGLIAFKYRHTRVGGTQIYSDNLSHFLLLRYLTVDIYLLSLYVGALSSISRVATMNSMFLSLRDYDHGGTYQPAI